MMKLLRNSPVPAAAMARNALKMTTIAPNISVGKEEEETKRVSKDEEPSSAAANFKSSAIDTKEGVKVEEMTEEEIIREVTGQLQEIRKITSDFAKNMDKTETMNLFDEVKKVMYESDKAMKIRETKMRRACLISGATTVVAAGMIISEFCRIQG